MRLQFVNTVTDIMESDSKTVLILGDIGVYSFRHLTEKYPERVINIGICEQASISICAGLAMEGFRPIFFTIASFAVERCLEQIKIDIGYQNLPVSIVSIGASFDYEKLGFTHHCPADVSLMLTIPNMTILTPGCNNDVDKLFTEAHGKTPVYMRLSDHGQHTGAVVNLGKATQMKYGNWGSVFVVGNLLGRVMDACQGMYVNIFYYTTLKPFDTEIYALTGKIAIVEPFYEGTMVASVLSGCVLQASVLSIGIPRGSTDPVVLTTEYIHNKLNNFFYE
jgi:transketolase